MVNYMYFANNTIQFKPSAKRPIIVVVVSILAGPIPVS